MRADATLILPQTRTPLLRWSALGAISLGFLYVIYGLYLAGQPVFAVICMALAVAIMVIYGWSRLMAWRYVFPGVATIAVFIVLPVVYTSAIGFTNYSASNLLIFDRVQDYHLAERITDEGSKRKFALTEDNRIYFPAVGDLPALITDPVDQAVDNVLQATPSLDEPTTQKMKAVVALRAVLQTLSVQTESNTLTMDGLRTFATSAPRFTADAHGVLTATDGTVLTPDHKIGFYRNADGEQVTPGWRVPVGFDNFTRILANDGIFEPIIQIFIWTVAFAFLSMVLTFALGTALAVILDWPHLAFKGVYRVLLLLPYAVPAFISILVFRGLFNQNFGEINMVLTGLFGVSPDWFTDTALARTMLLIVNTWLGYPYWMLLVAGFLQAVPQDYYKAAALEGSGPVRNFFAITLPHILPPSVPLLIANFAFNFNNVVLVLLLTSGGPDLPGTLIPAGSTDLLGSFTFRIAFGDSGQDFGMAGAISTVIFAITALIAYVNFRAMRSVAAKRAAR